MTTLDANRTRRWRKSSFSYNEDCVECWHGHGQARIRDSKDSGGAVLAVPRPGWAAFLKALTTD